MYLFIHAVIIMGALVGGFALANAMKFSPGWAAFFAWLCSVAAIVLVR